MEIAPRITVDEQIHHGAPVISGTRVPVSIVVGSLGGGMTREEVLREYELTSADLDAALSYAAEVISSTGATPLGV